MKCGLVRMVYPRAPVSGYTRGELRISAFENLRNIFRMRPGADAREKAEQVSRAKI
jgi:hypothetical protein